MNTKCGKCGAQLPEDQVYPDYCCDNPSAAAAALCGCGGWEQPWCQECLDGRIERAIAYHLDSRMRFELYNAAMAIDDMTTEMSSQQRDEIFTHYVVKSYRAAKAYIETVDRLFPEVGI